MEEEYDRLPKTPCQSPGTDAVSKPLRSPLGPLYIRVQAARSWMSVKQLEAAISDLSKQPEPADGRKGFPCSPLHQSTEQWQLGLNKAIRKKQHSAVAHHSLDCSLQICSSPLPSVQFTSAQLWWAEILLNGLFVLVTSPYYAIWIPTLAFFSSIVTPSLLYSHKSSHLCLYVCPLHPLHLSWSHRLHLYPPLF